MVCKRVDLSAEMWEWELVDSRVVSMVALLAALLAALSVDYLVEH